MDAEREPPEARWARLLSGEYGTRPKTKLLVLDEQWTAAGDDYRQRRAVADRVVAWLLEELTECARVGRMFLGSIPSEYRAALDEGAVLIRPYKDLLDIFGYHVEGCLTHALSIAIRCLDDHAFPWEISTAVELAERQYQWIASFGADDRPALIEQAVERFDRAARVLSEAVASEIHPNRADRGQLPPVAPAFVPIEPMSANARGDSPQPLAPSASVPKADGAARSPSLPQLRSVVESLCAFLSGGAYTDHGLAWKWEEEYYPPFVGLADALNAVRPVAASCQGWPPEVVRALPLLIATFDAVAREWGWGPLARPEPERAAFRDERFAWFHENIERPYYEAALSAQVGGLGMFSPFYPAAREGRQKGFTATMRREEGMALFPESERAYFQSFRLGTARPEIGREHDSNLSQAYHLLKAAVDEAEWRERASAAKPADSPTPAASGTEDPGDHATKTPRPDLVTLSQAAAMVHKSKRTLERWKTKGVLPPPDVDGGGGGETDFWLWKTIRPVLEAKTKIPLPETFPANRPPL